MKGNQNAGAPGKYMAKDFFVYQISFTSAIAAGAQATSNVTLDADADFLWQKFTSYAQVGSDGQTESARVVPGLSIIITDQASGRQLMNQAIPLPALIGTGPLPFILPTPKIFQSRGTISVQVQNLTDNTSYSQLYLAFVGTKLFLRQ